VVIHVNNLNKLLEARKELRNNPTPEENTLWQRLKNNRLGYKFRRQHSIGNFIADFYCPVKKLIIEIDGEQHLNSKEKDNERSNYLESLGFIIIRFWNKEINSEINIVIDKIETELL
jgi:leucyl-tRNA synthetase